MSPVGGSESGPETFLVKEPELLRRGGSWPELGPDRAEPELGWDEAREGGGRGEEREREEDEVAVVVLDLVVGAEFMSNILPSSPDFLMSPPVYGTASAAMVGWRSLGWDSGRPETKSPLLS